MWVQARQDFDQSDSGTNIPMALKSVASQLRRTFLIKIIISFVTYPIRHHFHGLLQVTRVFGAFHDMIS